MTPGYTDKDLTVEDVRDHFDEIRDEDGYAVPANLNEEMMLTLKALSWHAHHRHPFSWTQSGLE